MATEALSKTRENVVEWLEERQGRFIAMADEIWNNPELALAEYKACKLQSDDLAADGFSITKNIAISQPPSWRNGPPAPVVR